MTAEDDLPAGWLTRFRRGVLSGAGLMLLAVACCVLPTFAVWLLPGADTSPASSTVKSGALLALAAAHGGIRLDGESVSLVPLLVTGLLGWLIAGQARRAESWSSVVGLATGYAVASGLLARWAAIGASHAPAGRSMLAGAAFVGLVGGSARALEQYGHRLPGRYSRVGRAAAAVLCCYLAAGALLVAGSLVWHLSDAVAVQRQLAPGLAGLPVALLGIGLAPNAAVAGAGYLAGPGFSVGSHTRVSVLATSHGRLPGFPLLAAVPSGGPATVLGLLLIAAVAGLAGWLCVRLLRSAAGWQVRLAEVAAAAVLAAVGLAVLAVLAGGGIGTGALAATGVSWWAAGGSLALLVLTGSAAWLAVDLLRAAPVDQHRAAPVEQRARSVEQPASKPAPKAAGPADGTVEPPRLRAVAGGRWPSRSETEAETNSANKASDRRNVG